MGAETGAGNVPIQRTMKQLLAAPGRGVRDSKIATNVSQ
jgi:hypothetical protein